jgi:hypothetical protein
VPSLDLRFAENKSLVDSVSGQNLITFTRASTGTYVDSDGVIRSAANDIPRFNHNPLTGECLGLLVEEQRVNSIRNNTMVGAVAGTPGTLPTNWITAGAGMSTQVVGVGTESGITYVDIAFSSTGALGGTVVFEGLTVVAAANGQTWTASQYLRLPSGAPTNVSVSIRQQFRDVGGIPVATTDSAVSPTSAALISQRYTVTATAALGTVAFATSGLLLSFSAAGSITLRIGLPQLEQGAFATSVIPTTGTAATRTADVASVTGTNFSSWYRQDAGCVFVDGSTQNVLALAGGFLLINDPAGGNRVDIRQYRLQPIVQGGGGSALTWAGPVMPSIAANAFYRQAMAYSATADNHANAISGVVETSTTSLDNILANRLALFMRDAQTAPTGGTGGIIRRIAFWPQRLPNSTLQSITL